ncbi:AraC family transcriptional regulator [Cellulophaga lytica]|uniref:Transcriptional regulator, AraC family n=1 Tax=Cellulophaga lytica (strain ATCC 23178 / DSM 7489 / JCM 8516 / NBRC 14961 / NCIMB 1423 / VKM B-1433 / Cy l20) TaxID=867900 RepID=F0RBN0_CELLC|nr:AraC family transcriptional regulator [Cellulophaga lytica]ADY30680.1 transcriptional regulator, AraC family [Cellulophaga lytica DSM 7489]AIM61662.1 AraC family transcriptional regulator [Cellulophaga lytica]WQG78394.1 AraC family transcriptional regulator [Cellulophaga lytica]
MQVLEAHKPFEIQEIELTDWKQRPVKNNFFELVLIKNGKGTQCINYNDYEYEKGSIFLLPPLKCHSFNIKESTNFVFLKFTDSFFKNVNKVTIDRNEWFKEASYILSNYNQLPGDIIKNEVDRNYLESLIDMILQESRSYGEDSVSLITSFMTSILEILIRNIKNSTYFETPNNNSDNRITKMLAYINENIDKAELLKVENLADVFMMSPTYVSEYFKKQVKMSLREYIIKGKLKLVEIRLLNSDFTLTEIADELGFTDVSHLSKTFKRYAGTSIKEFKNNGEYMLLKRGSCAPSIRA